MQIKELKTIFDLFQTWQSKAVVLCGGEPLIREDITEIFKEINKRNLKIFLDTNGDFFFEHNDSIDNYVDVLGLPLDFSTKNKTYRNPENHDKILKILNYYKQNKPLTVRVGTVVTQDNLDDLSNIADILKNYDIDIWKLYEFTPIGPNASKNRKDLEINRKEFDEKINSLTKKYSNDLNIVASRRSNRNKAYFLINPDGTVFVPKDDLVNCEEIIIGHIFDKDILIKWNKIFFEDEYKNNAENTFNYKFR